MRRFIMIDFVNIPLLIARVFALMTLWSSFPGIQGVRVDEVQVPSQVQTGQTVSLSCTYNLEGNKLYSLNWWRGSQQFYQFSPNNKDQMVVYETPGINVDKNSSGQNIVVLRNVSRATAGKYKCEVLAEYPSFEKDSDSAIMEVIDVPDHDPTVKVNRHQWSPGERLLANCSYPGVTPQPHLQWYLNTDQIPPERSRLVNPKNMDRLPNSLVDRGGDPFSVSQLSLVLTSAHFMKDGSATLTCVAFLPELYRRSTEVTFTMPGFRAAAPSQKFYGSGQPHAGGEAVTMVALLGSLVFTRMSS